MREQLAVAREDGPSGFWTNARGGEGMTKEKHRAFDTIRATFKKPEHERWLEKYGLPLTFSMAIPAYEVRDAEMCCDEWARRCQFFTTNGSHTANFSFEYTDAI